MLVVPENGDQKGRVVVEERRMYGRLLHQSIGEGGFGYDPIFIAEGQQRSNAELSPREKNALSHRGKAFRALAPTIAATIELGGNVTPAQARP